MHKTRVEVTVGAAKLEFIDYSARLSLCMSFATLQLH